jgi:outer membrane protein OmpA-like peptidoglycan-associated protein
MYETSNTHWIPLSDLMMGLMMVFLLLATLYMLRVEQTTTLIVKEYEITRKDLKLALQEEFAENFKQWDAEFLGDMTIRFRNPEVLFGTGSDILKPEFSKILEDFIPRYITILTSEQFKGAIKEIRIEGHTSTFWTNSKSNLEAYFKNMALSQARTRTTLKKILNSNTGNQNKEWLKKRLTANGLSSSQPIIDINGFIDEKASQRVEFRIVTNADESIERIAKSLGKNEDL